jgi:hypothetical protein
MIGQGEDCGSTGGAMTTGWNIAGQGLIWRAFEDGLLNTKGEIPYVKDLLEDATGFLGHYYNAENDDWFTSGVKVTGDNAKKAIPFSLYKYGQTNLHWQPRKEVKANEILANLIASGTGDVGIKEFYEWVRDTHISEELYSTQERLEALVKTNPDFIDLTDEDLADLAFPYKLKDD